MRNPTPTARRHALSLCMTPEDRGLFDRAARVAGTMTAAFVLDAARRAAEDVVMDRTLFRVGPEAFEGFRARLDEAPRPNDRLRSPLQAGAPWENTSESSRPAVSHRRWHLVPSTGKHE